MPHGANKRVCGPLVSALPSFIRDTKDFLFKLEFLPPLPPGAVLSTMDVVGLYTNILNDVGLTACEQVLQGCACQVPPTADIISLAQLVLELNSFTYNKQHYLQFCGTAMGTRKAPSYAQPVYGSTGENDSGHCTLWPETAVLWKIYWWRVWSLGVWS